MPGWGPGQLENEMAQRGWFTEPEDPKLLFDADRDVVWKEALAGVRATSHHRRDDGRLLLAASRAFFASPRRGPSR